MNMQLNFIVLFVLYLTIGKIHSRINQSAELKINSNTTTSYYKDIGVYKDNLNLIEGSLFGFSIFGNICYCKSNTSLYEECILRNQNLTKEIVSFFQS